MISYRIVVLKSRTVSLYMRCSAKILRGKSKTHSKDYDFATEVDTKGKNTFAAKIKVE